MDIQTILPIVGVISGWFLKEISDFFKQRNIDRKEIGTALTGLLQLDGELRRLQTFLEYYKDRAGSWKDYETFRAKTSRRYLQHTDPIESIQMAVKVLASKNPLNAVLLQDSSILLTSFYKLNLDELTSNKELYFKSLSTFEVMFDISQDILKKFILKLAWLHGSLTYIRIKILWRRCKSKVVMKNQQFMEKQLDEIFKNFTEKKTI